jgi:hypothetical protein
MEDSYDTGSGAGLLIVIILFLAAIVVTAVLVVPRLGVAIDTSASHAIARHGEDAATAHEWISQAGPGNRFDCPDGRTRIVVQIDGRHWALGVLDGTTEITAFITSDKNYARHQAERCGALPSDLSGLGLAQ